jgi:hypothetical protein
MQNQKFGLWLITDRDNTTAHLKIVNREANPIKSYDTINSEAALKYAAKDTYSQKMIDMGLTTDCIDDFRAVLLAQCGLKAEILSVKKQVKRNMQNI